jgi:protein-S-isoprenylcysteine O-methyltransferase Ste14
MFNLENKKQRIHYVLALSYTVYFLALILGLIFSAIWPFKILQNDVLINFSSIILLLSSLLILWAQASSKKFDKLDKENITKKSFTNGPYRFTKNPSNWGLFFSIVSFGFIINSFFVILFSLITFLLSRIVFLKKEEALLENKYGKPYFEYKKSVKF